MDDIQNNKKESESFQNDWMRTKCFVIICFTVVIVYKIALSPTNIVLDFPTILSLLLAFFAVGLSALFYFKATESSNKFYDNTYKFTQDIASLLVKIESGFGERLRHLGEEQTNMRQTIENLPNKYEVEDTKIDIEKEEDEIKSKLKAKDKLIDELTVKANLSDEDKKLFKSKLDQQLKELSASQQEINYLKRKLENSALAQQVNEGFALDEDMILYIRNVLFKLLPVENIIHQSKSSINKNFQKVKPQLSKAFIRDLTKNEMLTQQGTITGKGAKILKNLAQNNKQNNLTMVFS